MVIWVDWLLAAHLSAEDLDGSIRNDLVRVHVGLCAGTSLEDGQGEVIDEFEVGNLSSSFLDCFAELGIWIKRTLVAAQIDLTTIWDKHEIALTADWGKYYLIMTVT